MLLKVCASASLTSPHLSSYSFSFFSSEDTCALACLVSFLPGKPRVLPVGHSTNTITLSSFLTVYTPALSPIPPSPLPPSFSPCSRPSQCRGFIQIPVQRLTNLLLLPSVLISQNPTYILLIHVYHRGPLFPSLPLSFYMIHK